MSTNSNIQKDKCFVCTKTVYPLEKTSIDGRIFHQDCLRCKQCNHKISSTNFGKLDEDYYCKPHMMELFKRRGKYEGKSSSSSSTNSPTTSTPTTNKDEDSKTDSPISKEDHKEGSNSPVTETTKKVTKKETNSPVTETKSETKSPVVVTTPKTDNSPKPKKEKTTTTTNNLPKADKCYVCTKTVYPLEKASIDGRVFHTDCFRCKQCNYKISAGNFGKLEEDYYCKPHMMELFKRRGKYEGKSPTGNNTETKSPTVNKEEVKKEEPPKEEPPKTQDEVVSEEIITEEVVTEEIVA